MIAYTGGHTMVFRALFVAICCFVTVSHSIVNAAPTVEDADYWNGLAKEELRRAKVKPNIAVAKNVILFLGDGLGISTVTAARILKGQLKNQPGEEQLLSFENFPHVALSKTYNTDSQTADSAGTATAILAGVKTNYGVLGVDASVKYNICDTMDVAKMIDGIMDWSQVAGKSVGLVTTTRITHATPAAAYAHTPFRDWESDHDMVGLPPSCSVKDVATQLIEDNPDIQVILGGGRGKFLLNGTDDPEDGLLTAGRLDRDLIELWQQTHKNKGRSYKYVWNQTEFNAVDPTKTDYLFGLFGKSHMQYELERESDKGGEPSLAEMTEKAIQILSKNPKGYFLLVEGGRIDHAHHESRAVVALHDTLAFDKAVSKAVAMTNDADTLMVVTADHSHVFTIGGYPLRGDPIFGLTGDRKGGVMLGLDGLPFTTLGYTNGPGAFAAVNATKRPNITGVSTDDKDYKVQAAIPLKDETHAGEDVGIYATGPMSHLFHGVHEQNYIAHVMAYASCVGRYSSPDNCAKADVQELVDATSGGHDAQFGVLLIISIVLTVHITLGFTSYI